MWKQIQFFVWLVLVLVGPGHAQVQRATVAVDGMACPFCAYGVEKRLRKVDSVGSVSISTRDGEATLRARNGASIAVEQVPSAVRKAGFTPGVIQIDATGRVASDSKDAASWRATSCGKTGAR